MTQKNAWETITPANNEDFERLCSDYIAFISKNKTERECVSEALSRAEKAGYKPLQEYLSANKKLKAGDKVWATLHNKALILVCVGSAPFSQGFNIIGAHIDSPRLDVKQNPIYESDGLVLLDTHYYGGIKKYQWVSIPLALHGVVCKTDGTSINVVIGEDASDTVFTITDILPHLGQTQFKKDAAHIVEGEDLDLLVGSKPLSKEEIEQAKKKIESLQESSENSTNVSSKQENIALWEKAAGKDPVRARILRYLEQEYGIEEKDFLSAELEIVPAGSARHCGFDKSMVLGYGQDDRVCAYASLVAQLSLASPQRTAVCMLVDKEEIGSVGATGMESMFFENTIAELMECAQVESPLMWRRALAQSRMLSCDVSAGFDPLYAGEFEKKNAAFLGRGLVFNKYTGARGKSGSNDASAEYVALVNGIMDSAGVVYQTAELGRVDAGGGNTIAYIPAKYTMDVIDSGVAVLSMHAPWEVTSKADLYQARLGYQAFLESV